MVLAPGTGAPRQRTSWVLASIRKSSLESVALVTPPVPGATVVPPSSMPLDSSTIACTEWLGTRCQWSIRLFWPLERFQNIMPPPVVPYSGVPASAICEPPPMISMAWGRLMDG